MVGDDVLQSEDLLKEMVNVLIDGDYHLANELVQIARVDPLDDGF